MVPGKKAPRRRPSSSIGVRVRMVGGSVGGRTGRRARWLVSSDGDGWTAGWNNEGVFAAVADVGGTFFGGEKSHWLPAAEGATGQSGSRAKASQLRWESTPGFLAGTPPRRSPFHRSCPLQFRFHPRLPHSFISPHPKLLHLSLCSSPLCLRLCFLP